MAQIVCDETGYGESEEIYLGNYILRQREIPEYYASYTEDVEVEVHRKSAIAPSVNYFPSERTRINITVVDELYESRAISDAEFTITPSGGLPYTVKSDHLGKIRIDEVDKSTAYRIKQTGTTGNYQINPGEYTVNVTADGRISGESAAELILTNRMIRVSISLTDEFSSAQVPGVELSLYNAANELVHTWTTSGVMQSYTDLTPGNYSIVMNDGSDHRYDITVRDQAEIQEFNILTTYILHYLLYGGIALAVILAAVILLIIVRRRKKKKAKQSEEG